MIEYHMSAAEFRVVIPAADANQASPQRVAEMLELWLQSKPKENEMTDPIRIPLDSNGGLHMAGCIVTPELARQIVDLSGAVLMPPCIVVPPDLPTRNPVLSNHREPFLGTAHQSELEQAHKPVDAGPAVDRRKIAAELIKLKNDICQSPAVKDTVWHTDTETVCDALWRLAMDLDPSTEIDNEIQKKDTPPADGAAAVSNLVDAIIFSEWEEQTQLTDPQMKKFAVGILAAIRAGKVPGLHCMPHLEQHLQRQCNDIAAKDAALAKRHLQVKEMHGQIAALSAQLAEATRERDRALDEAGRATVNASNHAHDAETVRRERDTAMCGNDLLIKERDRLAAEVERLKGRKVTLPAKIVPKSALDYIPRIENLLIAADHKVEFPGWKFDGADYREFIDTTIRSLCAAWLDGTMPYSPVSKRSAQREWRLRREP